MHVPCEIYALVCSFAFGACPKKHLFDDLDHVIQIQNAIPAILLRQSIPCLPIFEEWSERYLKGLSAYCELFTPNPYVKHNPYTPTHAITDPTIVWSYIPYYLVDMLKSSVIRKNKTYRGVIYRKVVKFITSKPVSGWNKVLRNMFKEDFWLDVNSYNVTCDADRHIILKFCRQLQESQFVAP